MSVVAVASGKGSPGATTLALALALMWPRGEGRRVVLVEADPDGGTLHMRLGLRADPGLLTLASAARHGLDDALLRAHEQQLADGVGLLVGTAAPEQMRAALSSIGERLAQGLASQPDLDAVVDIGRASARSTAAELARSAGITVLAARPRRDEVEGVAFRARDLAAIGSAVGLVCIGTRPYLPAEFAEVAGIELIGVVDDDRRTAAALAGDGVVSDRLLRRSALLRQAGDLAVAIVARLRPHLVGAPGNIPLSPAALPEVVRP